MLSFKDIRREHNSSVVGRSASLSLRHSRATSRRGWVGEMRSRCSLRRSSSRTTIGSRAEGGSEARVTTQQFGHAKVGHLGSPAADQEDIVAAEVTVQYLVAMEVGESLCHIVANVHLHVERKGRSVYRPLQEAIVRLSSISFINRTGNPESGSAQEPRYWIILGCLRRLRKLISRWNRSTMR